MAFELQTTGMWARVREENMILANFSLFTRIFHFFIYSNFPLFTPVRNS